jgi:hypothetical protein
MTGYMQYMQYMTGCAIAIKNRNELEGDADEDGWDFWTGNESSLIFTFSFAS